MNEQNANPDDFVPTPPPSTTPTTTPSELAPATDTGSKPGSTRKWLVGAVLVTAGVVAGSGATYALTAQASPAQGQFSSSQGGPGYGRMGGGSHDGFGGPPGTSNGTGPEQGTAPSGAPTTQTG